MSDFNFQPDYGQHPSPFLEGSCVQYAWDSTSLGYLKECPRKYYLTMLEGWRSKADSVHFTFGIHFHRGLELYDKAKAAGATEDEAQEAAFKIIFEETAGWNPDHPQKTRDTLLRSLVWYWETYRDDQAKTILLADGSPAVELSFRLETEIPCTPDRNYILSGHMDRIVDFGGLRYIMDRKTTGGSLSSYYFNQYNPDNQITLYTLAGRAVYDIPVQGVMIDAAQIMVGFTTFARGITMRSNGQLEEWLTDLDTWFTTAAYYAERRHWPMNEKSCNNYGGCVFKGICNQDPAVRESFLKTDFEKKYWNPLEPR